MIRDIKSKHIILMSKYPEPGRVKKRLAATMGKPEATRIAKILLKQAVNTILKAAGKLNASVELCVDGGTQKAWDSLLNLSDDQTVQFSRQATGDLGIRMETAIKNGFKNGADKVILVGSDIPSLTSDIIAEAFKKLTKNDAVFGPTEDGGYYLAGLSSFTSDPFGEIPWSTPKVLNATLHQMEHKKTALLPQLFDIDIEKDFNRWLQQSNTQAQK